MKKLQAIVFLLLSFVCLSCGSSEKTDFEYKNPVPLGDPFIMLYDNVYYAYGTNAENGIEVYTSDDLLTWKKEPVLALDKKDSWADRWFWAPEEYYYK